MTEDKKFEALGRYVDARERVTRLLGDRTTRAGKITAALPFTSLKNAEERVDIDTLQSDVDELSRIDLELARAVADMNHHAADADRKPYRPTYL